MSDETTPDEPLPEEAADTPEELREWPLTRVQTLSCLLVAVIAVVAALAWVYGRDDGAQVVASYRDAELTTDDILAIVASDPDADPTSTDAAVTPQSAAQVATTFLQVEALFGWMDDEGTPVTDQQMAEGAEIVAARGIDPESDAGVALARLEAARTALFARIDSEVGEVAFEAPVWLCVSHILVDTEQEALAILAELEGGAQFGAIAVERSIDPSAATNGGDLGCAAGANYVPEFTAAAAQVDGSGIAGPAATQFGFHVLDVRAIGVLGEDEFPELTAEQVEAGLAEAQASSGDAARSELNRQILTSVFADLAEGVWVDPQFGQFDPVNSAVIPPGAQG